MAILHSSRLKNSGGKKYYISLDDTFGNSSYSVYSFSDNTDYDNKTGTLMYTEPFRKFKKGATDDLINDNEQNTTEIQKLDREYKIQSLNDQIKTKINTNIEKSCIILYQRN